jgi:diguanylate cyclase (GGDEF)-like protein
MSLRSPNALILAALAAFTASAAAIASEPIGAPALAAAVPGALAFALMVGAAALLLSQFLRRGGARFLWLAMTELCCATLAAPGAATGAAWAWTWVAGQLLLPAGLALSLWAGPEPVRRALAPAGLRRQAIAGATGAVALGALLIAVAILLPHRSDPAALGAGISLVVVLAALAALAAVLRRARRNDIERWIAVSAAVSTSATILGLAAADRGTVAWWASRCETILAAFALLAALWDEYDRLYRKLTLAGDRLRLGAGMDPATRTLGREAILAQGEALLPGIEHDRAPLTVAVVELEDYPTLVARHGALVCDRILAEVARRIVSALRDNDLVGRLGGGSFLLLLTDTDARGGSLALQRVVGNVRGRPISTLRAEIPTRICVGVAEAATGSRLDDAIERAYQAIGIVRAQGSEHALSRAASANGSSAPPPPPAAPESHAA